MAEPIKEQNPAIPIIKAILNGQPLNILSRIYVVKVLCEVNNIPEEEVEKLIEEK